MIDWLRRTPLICERPAADRMLRNLSLVNPSPSGSGSSRGANQVIKHTSIAAFQTTGLPLHDENLRSPARRTERTWAKFCHDLLSLNVCASRVISSLDGGPKNVWGQPAPRRKKRAGANCSGPEVIGYTSGLHMIGLLFLRAISVKWYSMIISEYQRLSSSRLRKSATLPTEASLARKGKAGSQCHATSERARRPLPFRREVLAVPV